MKVNKLIRFSNNYHKYFELMNKNYFDVNQTSRRVIYVNSTYVYMLVNNVVSDGGFCKVGPIKS